MPSIEDIQQEQKVTTNQTSENTTDDKTLQEQKKDLPVLTLNILEYVVDKQMKNGLRHGDYQSYRNYCSRRLRHLRQCLQITHGKGRYVPKSVTPEEISDVRYLHIPLVKAERAWAYATQLKMENTTNDSRKKLRFRRRLEKASKWSSELEMLCSKRADQRTRLEAEVF